ncbi:MAG: hypothetical protein ACI9P5_004907, partial [Saprospiraceae bacterium]
KLNSASSISNMVLFFTQFPSQKTMPAKADGRYAAKKEQS